MPDDATKQMAERVKVAIGAVNPKLKDMSDVILKMGGTSKSAINAIRGEIRAMRELKNVRGLESVLTKAMATAYLGVSQAANKALASSATIGTMLKNITVSTGKGNKVSKPIYSMVAEALKPSEGFVNTLKFIRPQMVQGAANAKDMGLGLMKLGIYGAIVDVVLKSLIGGLKGAQENMKFLSNTMSASSATWGVALDMFGRTRQYAALLGVSSEEVGQALNGLQKNFVWNSIAMEKLGAGGAGRVADSVASFIAQAKGAGLSAEAAGELGSSLVLMGGELTNLTDGFAEFHSTLRVTGLTTDYLSNMLSTLAPVSMTSAVAAKDLYSTMGAFSKTFKTSTDPVLKFLNSAGKQRLMADSMQQFVEISSKLRMPELLAFGSKTAPGLSPWKALGESLGKNQSRTNILLNMMNTVMNQTQGGESKRFAVAAMLEGKGASAEQAYVLANMIADYNKAKQQTAATDIAGQKGVEAQALKINAALTQSIGDPMERLIALVQQFMTATLRFFGIISGGGSLMRSVMSMGTKPIGTTPESGGK